MNYWNQFQYYILSRRSCCCEAFLGSLCEEPHMWYVLNLELAKLEEWEKQLNAVIWGASLAICFCTGLIAMGGISWRSQWLLGTHQIRQFTVTAICLEIQQIILHTDLLVVLSFTCSFQVVILEKKQDFMYVYSGIISYRSTYPKYIAIKMGFR